MRSSRCRRAGASRSGSYSPNRGHPSFTGGRYRLRRPPENEDVPGSLASLAVPVIGNAVFEPAEEAKALRLTVFVRRQHPAYAELAGVRVIDDLRKHRRAD